MERRTSEEVLTLAQHAKLSTEELRPITYSLEFSEDYRDDSSMKLIEIDSHLLQLLNAGETLTIRGDADEPSVLCTKDKSYDIREAEISNSLLLIPNQFPEEDIQSDSHTVKMSQVHSIHFKYLELKSCQPRLGKLLQMLEERPYSGEYSANNTVGYNLDELLNHIQCSEEQLLVALKKFLAYQIDGCWQVLDFEYHFKLLSSILNFIDSESWNIRAIDKQVIINMLKGLEPEHLLNQCFDYFFIPTGQLSAEGNNLYEVNDDEVSKFCAVVLLKPAGRFNLNEFLNIWQQSVPEGVTTHLSQLKGIALVDVHSSPPTIWHFPATKMPPDVAQTLTLLFETKEKWSLEEISPYLEDFASSCMPVATLLNKYARSSTFNGVKYFSSRHSR